jgi:hypothetical protein
MAVCTTSLTPLEAFLEICLREDFDGAKFRRRLRLAFCGKRILYSTLLIFRCAVFCVRSSCLHARKGKLQLSRMNGVITGAALLHPSAFAEAQPVQWVLSGVTFNGGGKVADSFLFDPTSDRYSGININTTAITVVAGHNPDSIRVEDSYYLSSFAPLVRYRWVLARKAGAP